MLNRLYEITRIISIILLFLFLFILASFELNDPDTWLHLKTGQYILSNKSVPKADIYSFTMEGKEWINHEWLSQVIFYGVHRVTGINGLIFLRIIILLCLFGLLLGIGYKRNSHLFILLLTLLAILTAKERFRIRPELFSMFFLSIYLFILERKIRTRYLYLLPFLQILWANMHGYYILGPL